MKFNKNETSNESGFSLIELMVVVAIISVLSTIAMPNYNSMVGKARQTEAKSALASIYTVEKAYFAEGATYTYCLYQAGYIPEGARIYYKTGYQGYSGCAACVVDVNSSVGCNIGAGIPWKGGTHNDGYFGMNVWASPGLTNLGVATSFEVTADTFTSMAIGSITSIGIFDIWTIDNNRVLTNIQPGI